MEMTGEITLKIPIGKVNDLKMELIDILDIALSVENNDKHRPLIATSELYCKLQSITEQGNEHKTWDKLTDQEK